MKSLPGWTTKIDEVSNGVFIVTITDSFGRIVEVTNDTIEDAIRKVYQDVFEIEKQVSNNWNMFLYDLCLAQLSDTVITTKNYNNETFGSWLIEVNDNRLVYMGKDYWLVAQTKKDNKWFDKTILKREEMTYSLLLTVINSTRPRLRTT